MPPRVRRAARLETQVTRDDEERKAQEQLAALQARKRELLLELRSLEDTIRHAQGDQGANAGVIPQDTRISMDIATNRDKSSFEFVFATTNGTFVSSVVILDTDGGLFDGETLVAMPANPTSSCTVALFPKKNFPANLKIQIPPQGFPQETAGRQGGAAMVGQSPAGRGLPPPLQKTSGARGLVLLGGREA